MPRKGRRRRTGGQGNKGLRGFARRRLRGSIAQFAFGAGGVADGANGMNAAMEMSHEEALRVRLEVLRREHRDLDHAIQALEESGRAEQLTLRRLKKQKLGLRDAIQRIEDELLPDIIA